MDIEVHAFYVQDRTSTLYEVVEHDVKGKKVALENVMTLKTTAHNEAWLRNHLRFVRGAAVPESVEVGSYVEAA